MVAGVRQAPATARHAHAARGTVGGYPLAAGLQRGQAPGLRVPLLTRPVPARGAPAALLPDRQAQAVPDRRDPSVQRRQVRGLRPPRQGPLVVACLRDRSRPPRRRRPGQRTLAVGPPRCVVVESVPAASREITTRQPAEEHTHPGKDVRFGVGDPQPGPDRDPGRSGRHERRVDNPQPGHRTVGHAGSFAAHANARSARSRAERRPYRRAQNDVNTSTMSPTRSKSPTRSESTSDSTRTTRNPATAAHPDKRATCRSRSTFWSWDETRAYRPTPPVVGAVTASGFTRIVRGPTRTAGTGNVPSRNHRYAACGCTPCAIAHSRRFTPTPYNERTHQNEQKRTQPYAQPSSCYPARS